ncbi:alpha-glucosidase/alpha-galactosidase [Litorilinea aerophila]|uniref:Alpha-glucosidase/alpha-galactosidase n=1 Tax=Litorilinea aerophila TaxID=1204385 RepID=A0A540VFQ9_9CHLR|nr:alpha-glucosidase/alpha-galactosidase [Litorilinea aerophila]MCC9076595.1 alpha-glucosidase/alpha-galactosidase [Litorilinea aerophila]GIV77632.1 MAG: alpha-glucosidase/alpha-galactosidase [Litorilinea sp.]
MSTPIKIAVIGAGSAQFSLGLVKDLCLTPGLVGSLVHFMDIDPERLAMIHRLAERYRDELGTDLQIDSTTDRRVALQDADFVINTASAQSHHHQRAIRELAEQYGYYYGRVNLGNFYNLRLMLEVARDMEEICPDAWLIQSGNPVFEGCTLMTRETSIKVCGLCHGHYGVYGIAQTLGLDLSNPRDLTWQAPGLNHNIWLTHFFYRGEDAYPLLDEWIATKGEEYWRTHVATRTHDIQMSRGAIHQYRMYGLMPIGDTPRRGGWWYHTDIQTKKYWFGEPWGGPDTELARPLFVANLEKRLAEMTRIANDPKASVIEAFGAEKTREQQVPIIDGLVNDNEGYFQVNVPNKGALAGVPDDVVVEVPAIVNKKGIQPLRVEPLPAKIMVEQILPEWLDMERELLAFKTRDRSMLLWSVLDSHQTRSYDQAVEVLEALLAMPGHEEMNEYYQFPPNSAELLLQKMKDQVTA